MQCPSYHPWSKQRPLCLLLFPKHKKTAPRQAQPHRSSNPRTNLAHRIQKKLIFQTLKTHQQNCQEFFCCRLFSSRDTLPRLVTTPLHSATAQVSPWPPTGCLPHTSRLHPSKPAHKQAPFIMQLSKPSLGQPNFTTTALARLCCGQEPEPHHAPQPGGRAAPKSAHLF